MWRTKTLDVLSLTLRLILFLFLWLTGVIVSQSIARTLTAKMAQSESFPAFFARATLGRFFVVLGTMALFCLFERLLDKRPLNQSALSTRHAPRRFLGGFLFGSALIGVTVFLQLLQGSLGLYSLTGSSLSRIALQYGVGMFLVAFAEELAIRGYCLEQMRRLLGSHVAVFISAALFGLLHLTSSIIFAISAFAAGLTLGYAYVVYGLYCSTGIHFAWNWLSSILFASGAIRPHGEDYPDTQGLTATLVLALGLGLLLLSKRRRLFSSSD